MSEKQAKQEKQEKQVAIQTGSERFLANVQKQFEAEAGSPVAFSDYEKALAQHLFLKLDQVLKDFEAKRQKDGKKTLPYRWENVDMRKLSLDAVHMVRLGLDALIPNHIHPIPYLNGKTQKYDIDLRVGYVGKAYYRMEAAVEKPKDIILELVYSTDHFKPIKKSIHNEVESYEFEIQNPFNRGKIIGGFGYIVYDDPTKNKLVLVSEEEFQKARKYAQSDKFWSNFPDKMRYKTLVHRVVENIPVDPKKVNASYLYVESKDAEDEVRREINENANREVIDVPYTVDEEGGPAEDERQELEAGEESGAEEHQENDGGAEEGPGF